MGASEMDVVQTDGPDDVVKQFFAISADKTPYREVSEFGDALVGRSKEKIFPKTRPFNSS
jgi:hypothetical protein